MSECLRFWLKDWKGRLCPRTLVPDFPHCSSRNPAPSLACDPTGSLSFSFCSLPSSWMKMPHRCLLEERVDRETKSLEEESSSLSLFFRPAPTKRRETKKRRKASLTGQIRGMGRSHPFLFFLSLIFAVQSLFKPLLLPYRKLLLLADFRPIPSEQGWSIYYRQRRRNFFSSHTVDLSKKKKKDEKKGAGCQRHKNPKSRTCRRDPQTPSKLVHHHLQAMPTQAKQSKVKVKDRPHIPSKLSRRQLLFLFENPFTSSTQEYITHTSLHE